MMLLKSAHLACNNNHSLTEQTPPPPKKKVRNYLPTSQIVDRDTENQLYF